MTPKNILILSLLTVSQYIFSQTVYQIKDYGAVGDGITLCTSAINSAIADCSTNGGGRVVIPAGVFKSGTILMKNNVELHLEMGSTLLGSGNNSDYPQQPQPEYRTHLDSEGWYALIYGEGLSNIAVTGLGTIDGNGALHTGIQPRGILFISCQQIRIEGIKMLHSGSWMQHYLNCEDVLVDRIEVYNHANINNGAMAIDGCRRCTLSNAISDSDDDGITLKSSGAAASEDITIINCVVSSRCNAIKMGDASTGGFRNISIGNCVIKHTRDPRTSSFLGAHIPINGISGISLQMVDGGIMEGIAISNITMEDVECPLFIWLGNRARKHTDNAPEPPVGKIRNITISNIVAYNTGNVGSSISGLPGHDVENVTIDNVQYFNRGGITGGQYVTTHQAVSENENGYPEANWAGNLPAYVFFIRHVKNLSINNLMFGSKENDPRIPVIAVDVEKFTIGKSTFSGNTPHAHFVLLKDVTDFDIEKPLGWGGSQVVNNEQ